MRARASSYWSALPPWSASVRVHAPARCVWLMGVWWLHKQKQRGCTHAVRCGQWVHRGPRVRAVRVWLVRHVRAVGCVCPRLRMCLYDRDWDKKTPSPSRPLCCGGPRPMMWWTWIHTARQQSCWTLRFKACGRAACCWSQQQTWPTCAGTTGAHWLQCTGPCAHDPKCACVRACVCVCTCAVPESIQCTPGACCLLNELNMHRIWHGPACIAAPVASMPLHLPRVLRYLLSRQMSAGGPAAFALRARTCLGKKSTWAARAKPASQGPAPDGHP